MKLFLSVLFAAVLTISYSGTVLGCGGGGDGGGGDDQFGTPDNSIKATLGGGPSGFDGSGNGIRADMPDYVAGEEDLVAVKEWDVTRGKDGAQQNRLESPFDRHMRDLIERLDKLHGSPRSADASGVDPALVQTITYLIISIRMQDPESTNEDAIGAALMAAVIGATSHESVSSVY